MSEAGGKHYGSKCQPWDLQRHMKASGSAFVDARRADAIKYAFRIKGDREKLLDDLKKAKHCLESAIEYIEDINVCIECGKPCKDVFCGEQCSDAYVEPTKDLSK